MYICLYCNNNSNNLTGGVDYDSGPYSVTFPAGVTSVSFNILVHDNQKYEENKNFTLIISNDSLPSGVVIGNASKVTLIIRNDDSKLLCNNTYMYYMIKFTDYMHMYNIRIIASRISK